MSELYKMEENLRKADEENKRKEWIRQECADAYAQRQWVSTGFLTGYWEEEKDGGRPTGIHKGTSEEQKA